jgi:hypothetical protein
MAAMRAADTNDPQGDAGTAVASAPRRPRYRARIAAALLGMASGFMFFFCAVPPAHSGDLPPAAAGAHFIMDALRLLTGVAATESSADPDSDGARALPSGGIRN